LEARTADVLPKLELDKDVVSGQWRRQGDYLVLTSEDGSAKPVLQLPANPAGGPYRIEAIVVPHTLSGEIALHLPLAGAPRYVREITLRIRLDNNKRGGFEYIEQRGIDALDKSHAAPVALRQGQPNKILVDVLPGAEDAKLKLWINDEPIVAWFGDREQLTGASAAWRPRRTDYPAFGTTSKELVLRRLRLDPKGKEVKWLREEPAIAAAPSSPAPPPSPSTPGRPPGSVSADGTLTFAGHRYRYVGKTCGWMEAKDMAEQMGGHLAVITSKEEDEAVRQAFKHHLKASTDPMESLWLGASRPDAASPWRWVTGEPFGYVNWANAEPDLNTGEPPWVLTYRDRAALWRDDGVTLDGRPLQHKGFIIEWDDLTTPMKEPAIAAVPTPPPSPPPPAPVVAPAAPASELEKRLSEIEARFLSAYERDVGKAHDAAIADLTAKYSAAVQRATAAATQAGQLDEALKLRAEQERVEKQQPLPPQDAADVPPSLKQLRATFREQVARLEAETGIKAKPLYQRYEELLEAYQKELTQQQKLDDALKVKMRRDAVAAKRSQAILPGRPTAASAETLTLFNGSSLDGWIVRGTGRCFEVEDGAIKTTGQRGNLFYTGVSGEPPTFRDFILTLKAKTMPGGNSGVWLHCTPATLASDVRAAALEIQIDNSTDIRRSGSLYGIRDVKEKHVKEGEWFDLQIEVRTPEVTASINGKQVLKWRQPNNWKPPEGVPNARLSEGTIGLQSNGGVTYLKDIQLRPL
jgi:hypothetical protein